MREHATHLKDGRRKHGARCVVRNGAFMSAIELLPDLGVITVRLAGAVAIQQRAEALEALLELQAQTSYSKVLIDLSDATVVDGTSSETIQHAARLARNPIVRGTRIAYIGEPKSGTSVESLAALRGYFYQRFRSRSSALRWLCA